MSTGFDGVDGLLYPVSVVGRIVEEVHASGGSGADGTVDEVEFDVEIGEMVAEGGCFVRYICYEAQGYVPVWDLKMAPLVPFPWRQRILMVTGWLTPVIVVRSDWSLWIKPSDVPWLEFSGSMTVPRSSQISVLTSQINFRILTVISEDNILKWPVLAPGGIPFQSRLAS